MAEDQDLGLLGLGGGGQRPKAQASQFTHGRDGEPRILNAGEVKLPRLTDVQQDEVIRGSQAFSKSLDGDLWNRCHVLWIWGEVGRIQAPQNPRRTGRTSSEVMKACSSDS